MRPLITEEENIDPLLELDWQKVTISDILKNVFLTFYIVVMCCFMNKSILIFYKTKEFGRIYFFYESCIIDFICLVFLFLLFTADSIDLLWFLYNIHNFNGFNLRHK